MIISPKESITKTIVQVYSDNEHVYLKFPETNDTFRKLVKSRLYYWDSYPNMRWCKNTNKPSDRQAEITRLLLESGFMVDTDNDTITRAQHRNYESEHTRWIENKDNHYFRFCWYWSEDCYNEVRKLPASHYDKPCVIVPLEYYEEVIDFAQINNFVMTNNAVQLIDIAKQKMQSILFFEEETQESQAQVNYSVYLDLLDV